MGQPDQFTKRTFASDAERVTGGAFRWADPPESSLTWVKGDGLLLVQKPEALSSLPAPWSTAGAHSEILVEVKMPGDHLSPPVLDRIDLRRLARQIQRAEAPKDPWIGEQPIWTVAPHVPDVLEKRRTLTEIAPGCYRVGPYPFDYLWIAANELPLRDELIPFLIVRSGNALRDFAFWVLDRRPVDWLVDMVHVMRMSEAAENEMLERIWRSNDPELLAHHRRIARKIVEGVPEVLEPARRAEARSMLRMLFEQRGLPLGADLGARIDGCEDLATLERWFRAAVTAPSVAEALL